MCGYEHGIQCPPDSVPSWVVVLLIEVEQGRVGREADIRSECHTEVSSGGVKGLVDIATGHSLRYD